MEPIIASIKKIMTIIKNQSDIAINNIKILNNNNKKVSNKIMYCKEPSRTFRGHKSFKIFIVYYINAIFHTKKTPKHSRVTKFYLQNSTPNS